MAYWVGEEEEYLVFEIQATLEAAAIDDPERQALVYDSEDLEYDIED